MDMLTCQCQVMSKKHFNHFQYQPPKYPQLSPFAASIYVKAINEQSQYALKIDSYSLLPPEKITKVKQIVRSFLYYAIAINSTLVPALIFLVKNDAATKQTEYQCHRVIDYVATQPNLF